MLDKIIELATSPVGITVIKAFAIVNGLMGAVAVMTYVERRVSAIIQFRLGPNRVGPQGLLQPLADGIKFIWKQDIVPRDAYKPLFVLAPLMSLVPALVAFSVIPIGPVVEIAGQKVPLVIADLSSGILFVLAITSLGVYGIVMAGWSSRSMYSLMGGLRSSAQMISYELSLTTALVGALIIAGTLRPMEIVEQQGGSILNWNVFGGFQLFGFLIFLVASFAETNRLPFDMPEAESELVAGYHTEYSAMKFSMFFMAEYINMITASSIAVTVYLGGWQTGLPLESWGITGWPLWLLQMGAFVGKVAVLQFLFVWVRWSIPRFRYDQVMNLGWKALFPLALANVFVTALITALR